MAHKKAGSSSKNGRDSNPQYLGVKRYGAEATSIITQTIERWDGKEAAQRIELHVGRDLQFIRINGTIVGALAGLVAHRAGTGEQVGACARQPGRRGLAALLEGGGF